MRTHAEWTEAWARAAQWARSPGAAERRHETALMPVAGWQLYYYRGGAWSNPQSSATSASTSTTEPAAGAAVSATPRTPLPEGVRLEITLPPGVALQGTLTYDWFNPTSPSVP